VLLFGAGIGNTTSLPPLIAQVEFTRTDAQRVVPLIVAIGQGTYAFAPAAFGALRSLSAHETAAVAVAAAIIQALAVAAFLAGRRRAASLEARVARLDQYRQRLQPLGGELDEGVDLGGAMGAPLGDEMHRQRRCLPRLQQAHQLARGQLVATW